MVLPHVGQAQLLCGLLGNAIESYEPWSIAVLGCAGGNGLEKVPFSCVKRVVGIDFNQQYLDHAAARYRDSIPCLELYAGDIEVDRFIFDPVDIVFAGLIFEYVDARRLLRQFVSMSDSAIVMGRQPVENVLTARFTELVLSEV